MDVTRHACVRKDTARSSSISRIFTTALVAALAGTALAASAQENPTQRLRPLSHTTPIKLVRGPQMELRKEQVTAVVIMNSDSVAQARAKSADHRITAAAHAAIESRIAAQHSTIEPTIHARGGKVLGHYHAALNGIKVQIARGELAGLASLPGVTRVAQVARQVPSNVISVPFIGAPLAWQGTPGYKGDHVKIAIIDTGIDYTHANFGGPGTPADYTNAKATSTQPADPRWFGPNAPKVKGGIDLVGDDYNADDASPIIAPDPNPLDCAAHGSHVAGTAAGFGVTSDGKTYTGPYNVATYSNSFAIGPGVAPKADLYAVRVFGCAGSTNMVPEALEWAVENDMDVVNMSLGSNFGTDGTADAAATDAAAEAGIIIAAASGNAGPIPYVTSDPAAGDSVISVAATDAHAFLDGGVLVTLSSGASTTGVNENGLTLPSGSVPAVILNSGGVLGLGCNATDYPAGGVAGAIVVISRGTCTFDVKSYNAMAAGASALVVVNNSPNAVTPQLDSVTIPFIIVPLASKPTFAAAPSVETGTIVAANVANTGFAKVASFSSEGPRVGDGSLKPEITAPGVNVVSTEMGSGNLGVSFSGTSMATPHVAGVAALAVQAHPSWPQQAITASVTQTGAPTKLLDYVTHSEGGGLVQPVGATGTQVVAEPHDFVQSLGLLSFGVLEMTKDFSQTRTIILNNRGKKSASFSLSSTMAPGAPNTAILSKSQITVGANSESTFKVTLNVPGAGVSATHDAAGNQVFQDTGGYVSVTPTSAASNNGVALSLPYYAVTRARSAVSANLAGSRKNPVIRLANKKGLIAGNADFYAWSLFNPVQGNDTVPFSPRALGVESFPLSDTDAYVVFATNTWNRNSNPSTTEFDIYIDTNGDGVPDFVLYNGDLGLATTGTFSGVQVSILVNLTTFDSFIEAYVDAPTDGSIVESAVYASDLGLTPASPRISFQMYAFDQSYTGAYPMPGVGTYNVFAPAVSTGQYVTVAPGTTASVPVYADPVEIQVTPPLGLMVVVEDNVSGDDEATLVSFPN